MTTVLFTDNFTDLAEKTKSALKEFFKEKSNVLIKLHFGEPGNKAAFTPQDIHPIVDALKELQLRPILIDSPVKYTSPRNSIKGYQKVAEQKGFSKLAPVIIADSCINVKMKSLSVGVIKELTEADGVLVLSHVKGHSCSGFGGAVKNLGMGCVNKDTKRIIHELAKPKYIKNCKGCGMCVQCCPAGALKVKKDHVAFDPDTCYGCSICQLVCPHQCITGQRALFDDLLGQGAAAVISKLPKRTYYMNVIKNITKYCDCASCASEVLADDVGITFSDNPVAIDKASLDLIKQQNGKDIFKEKNHKDPLLHVNFTATYSNLSIGYELTLI